MALQRRIAVDLAKVYTTPTGRTVFTTLAWGDRVTVEKITSKHVEVKFTTFEELEDGSFKPTPISAFIRPSKSSGVKPSEVVTKPGNLDILRVDFVDVQQGDGAVVETPKGKVILIDGGDNQLFARYLASRYRRTRDDRPKEIDAVVVSHGDADHFAGLTKIHESETHSKSYKRLFIRPQRVYHNGLVKRSGTTASGKRRKETDYFGKTTTIDGKLVITELETDISKVSDDKMNKPFRQWKKALNAWKKRGAIKFERLSFGDDKAFDFLADEDIKVEVLGPLMTQKGQKKGLAFLGDPPKGPRIGHESLALGTAEFGGKSASHTVNGHSIILRLRYGNFRFLFAGDLNDQAERDLTRGHNLGELDLRAEVLKVPHHGSADFSAAFLRAVSPVISVVSSGDENAQKEYIHPRATLIGALGRFSRLDEPLIFVTELVAFFKAEGYVEPEKHRQSGGKALIKDGEAVLLKNPESPFFAFRRTAFGIVKIRTDGDRLVVFTNSGRKDLKESYAYSMDQAGVPHPERVRQV